MSASAIDYAGRCHCGACCITLRWPERDPIPSRRCLCSFCQRHGAVWTSHPQATLIVHRSTSLKPYRFGTETAAFMLCSTCGVTLAAISAIDGRDYAVVNTHCLQEVEAVLAPQDSDLDGETLDQRLTRRASKWIPNVIVQQP